MDTTSFSGVRLTEDEEPTVQLRHQATGTSPVFTGASDYDASKDGLENIDLDEIEVIRGSYHRIKSFGLPLKIHLGVGVVVSILCMLIWHWQSAPVCTISAESMAPIAPSGNTTDTAPADPASPSASASAPASILVITMPKFWWFFYPLLFFAFSVPAHHFFLESKWEKMAIMFVIMLNVGLFLTWAFRMPLGDPAVCATYVQPDGSVVIPARSTPPWPIFPAAVSLIGAVAAHYLKQPKESRRWFRLLLNEYWIVNGTCFLIWLFFGQGFPWWIFPLIVLALPVIIYRMRFDYKETRMWTYAAVISIALNLVLFLTWIFTPTPFPWPLFPLGLCGGLVFYLMRREANAAAPATASWEGGDGSNASIVTIPVDTAHD